MIYSLSEYQWYKRKDFGNDPSGKVWIKVWVNTIATEDVLGYEIWRE